MELKPVGRVTEVKQEERNGVQVGIVAGYISTWDTDSGGMFGVPDQFVKGAWLESLAEHRRRDSRPVRLKDHHGKTIGGFPIATVREDDTGLFGVGEINLDSQQGREAFSLARQGVLSDFSVGFTSLKDEMKGGVRRILKARLWEASVVDEPANPNARILEVKRNEVLLATIAADLRGCLSDLRDVRDRRSPWNRMEEKAAHLEDLVRGLR